MFDIGWSELVIIGIVALIAIGPKELPGALRALGHWMGKVRRMASEFQDQFRDAMREAEMADLKKQVDDMTENAKSYSQYDPLGDIRKDFENFEADKTKAVEPTAATTATSAAEGVPPPPPDDTSALPPATAAAADVPIAPAPSAEPATTADAPHKPGAPA